MKILFELPEIEEVSEADRRAYCGSIFAVFPRLEKDIKRKMAEHLVSTYTEAEDMNQILKGQGIMEGMAILLTMWQGASNEHIAGVQEKREEGS